MKISTIILTVLIAMTINTKAQIPNSGFENWSTVGSYDSLNGWGNANRYCSGTFYPVTKSTDNYPVSIGNYSIRLENNISLLPPTSYCGLGLVYPGTYKFPITGHPNSLTGYYKFLPQGGDTMIISVRLFNSGTQVANAEIVTTVAASSWISFNIPISAYSTADSASIRISSYCTCGSAANIPHGNSVLYMDNLNFDNLITNISEKEQSLGFTIFPNPSFGKITLSSHVSTGKSVDVKILNSLGQIVYADLFYDKGGNITITPELEEGMYYLALRTDDKTFLSQKLIITLKH